MSAQRPGRVTGVVTIVEPQCVFSHIPQQDETVTKMFKAIHAQEDKTTAREKARQVVEDSRVMKLKEAAKKVEDSIEASKRFLPRPGHCELAARTDFFAGSRADGSPHSPCTRQYPVLSLPRSPSAIISLRMVQKSS